MTKTKIMDSASILFTRYDYAEVNMRMIARQAGITGPAIYNHYKSKDELFSHTVIRMMGKTHALLSEILNAEGSWTQRLEQMLLALGERKKKDTGIQILSSTTQIKMAREPKKFQEIRKARNDIGDIFKSLIRDSIADGDLPETVNVNIAGDLLMAFSFNAIGAVTVHWDPKKHMDDIVGTFKMLIKPNIS